MFETLKKLNWKETLFFIQWGCWYNFRHSNLKVGSIKQKMIGFATLLIKYVLRNIPDACLILWSYRSGLMVFTNIVLTYMTYPRYEIAVATIKLIVNCLHLSYILGLLALSVDCFDSSRSQLKLDEWDSILSWIVETTCVFCTLVSESLSLASFVIRCFSFFIW